jgi:copper chaperone CopZ
MSAVDAARELRTADLDVTGMTCGSCAVRIERVLSRQAGVADATVCVTVVAAGPVVRYVHVSPVAAGNSVLWLNPRSSPAPVDEDSEEDGGSVEV